MANSCPVSLQACALRVARLDSNGVPHPGADSLYVTQNFSQVVMTPVLTTGDEFEVKNACGGICVNYKDCDRLKRLDITLDVCVLDPQLTELLAGGTTLAGSGGRVGYGAPVIGATDCPNGVSIEVFTKRVDASGALEAVYPYEHWVFPRVYLALGPKTFNNGPMSHPFTGYAIENENWYNGPANDWSWASDRVFQHMPRATLPTAVCGYQTIAST